MGACGSHLGVNTWAYGGGMTGALNDFASDTMDKLNGTYGFIHQDAPGFSTIIVIIVIIIIIVIIVIIIIIVIIYKLIFLIYSYMYYYVVSRLPPMLSEIWTCFI